MSTAIADTRKFKSLLRSIGKGPDAPPAEPENALESLLLSFLMWETSSDKALTALGKIRQHIVDLNDLRVTMPQELVGMIGERYPRAQDRALRMRATLRDIYLREHAMSLEGITEAGKRDVRRYIETLEGMVPYVAARVMLLRFGVHAVPVDDQLRDRLAEEGVTAADADPAELGTWITRQVKAGTGVETHFALQGWVDDGAKKRAGGRRKSPRTGGKKKSTRRKSSARKTASRS